MPNDTQNTEPATMHTPDGGDMEHSHLGPVLGVIIILLALILGGLYLWGGMLAKQAETPVTEFPVNNEPETPRATADTQILETMSTSDNLDAIEADISSTNLDSIDSDLGTIDAELNAALE